MNSLVANTSRTHSLKNIHLLHFKPQKVWIAYADITQFESSVLSTQTTSLPSLSIQSLRVRQLLMYLVNFRQDGIAIQKSLLNDSQYPYRLQPSGEYVCFSHSKDRVACALSQMSSIGLDIELRDISPQVAKRFFHHAELQRLDTLPIDKQPVARQLLWMLKEATIKQNNQPKLMAGLRVNHSHLLQKILEKKVLEKKAVKDEALNNKELPFILLEYDNDLLSNQGHLLYLPTTPLVALF